MDRSWKSRLGEFVFQERCLPEESNHGEQKRRAVAEGHVELYCTVIVYWVVDCQWTY